MNYRLTLQYDGTKLNGWQKQGNTEQTVQGKLERILARLYGEEIGVHGSGRTDAGVHALSQTANFHAPECFPEQEIQKQLNRYLPEDIRVISVSKAGERFHARLSACAKTYEYRIDNGAVADVFQRRYAMREEAPLNLPAMREAAAYLTGTHDFKSFCANKRMKKSTVRTISQISITQKGGIVTLRFYGNGFLYHMVRILSGTLIEVGRGSRNAQEMLEILAAKDRMAAGFTAPAQGLFLVGAEYC